MIPRHHLNAPVHVFTLSHGDVRYTIGTLIKNDREVYKSCLLFLIRFGLFWRVVLVVFRRGRLLPRWVQIKLCHMVASQSSFHVVRMRLTDVLPFGIQLSFA